MKFIKINCKVACKDATINTRFIKEYVEQPLGNIEITAEGNASFTLCPSCGKDFLKDLGVKSAKKRTKKEAKKVIDEIDTNNNGRITKKELEAHLTKTK